MTEIVLSYVIGMDIIEIGMLRYVVKECWRWVFDDVYIGVGFCHQVMLSWWLKKLVILMKYELLIRRTLLVFLGS